jgi:carbonic anhydrase
MPNSKPITRELFAKNRAWAESVVAEQPDLCQSQAAQQAP